MGIYLKKGSHALSAGADRWSVGNSVTEACRKQKYVCGTVMGRMCRKALCNHRELLTVASFVF